MCLTFDCALQAGGTRASAETSCHHAPLCLTHSTVLCKQRAAVWRGAACHSMPPPGTPHPTVPCRREAAVRLRVLNERTKTDPCPDGERCTDQAACKYYHTKLDQMPKIFFKERYCRIWQVRAAAGRPPKEVAESMCKQSCVHLVSLWIGRSLAAGLCINHLCCDPPTGRTPCLAAVCVGDDRSMWTRRACQLWCRRQGTAQWGHSVSGPMALRDFQWTCLRRCLTR